MEYKLRKIATVLAILTSVIACVFASVEEIAEESRNREIEEYRKQDGVDGLTPERKLSLQKFRETVKKLLADDYERSDNYLIGWLKSKNWNVDAAKKMLKASKLWKAYNKMEKLGQAEVEPEMLHLFPYTIYKSNETGCPVISYDDANNKWEVSEVILSHEFPRDGYIKLTNYFYQSYEKLEQELKKEYVKNKSCVSTSAGADLTGYQVSQISDIHGIQALLSVVHTFNNNYPYLVDNVILTNVPDSFSHILEIIQKTLSTHIDIKIVK